MTEGDPGALRSVGERIERLVLPRSRFWGAWAPYARTLADLLEGDAAARRPRRVEGA